MRLLWAFGVENRQLEIVLPFLQDAFDDLRFPMGRFRPPISHLHSDKASEFFEACLQ